jgi:hypothetical protein
MPLAPTLNSRLATTAFVCGVLAFVLWVLSYSWVPFALMGRESYAVMYIVVTGEAGGLLASLGAIGCGLIGRKYTHSGTRAHRLASQGLLMGQWYSYSSSG